MRFSFLLSIHCLLLWPCGVAAADLRVVVASNFMAPMRALADEFERHSEHRLILSFSSSGKAYAQIVHGAPFDVFLSADEDKPRRLIRDGLALQDSLFHYATGRLVLWCPGPASCTPLQRLQSGDFDRLAIANPRLAPYGRAALEVLQKLQLADRVQSKLVSGDNIAQTFQFVQSGNAALGFVARSQLPASEHLSTSAVWEVPADYHQPIRQSAVILRASRLQLEAQQLLDFLRSPLATRIIQSYGYDSAAGSLHSKGVRHAS